MDIAFLCKCRRCGAVGDAVRLPIGLTSESWDMARKYMRDLVNGDGSPLPMNSIHLCNETSCGVTDFIGYEPRES